MRRASVNSCFCYFDQDRCLRQECVCVCTFVVKVRCVRKGNWFFGSLIISADTMILTTTSSFLQQQPRPENKKYNSTVFCSCCDDAESVFLSYKQKKKAQNVILFPMLIYVKIVQLVDGFTLTVSLGLAKCQNESDDAKNIIRS